MLNKIITVQKRIFINLKKSLFASIFLPNKIGSPIIEIGKQPMKTTTK